MTELRTLIVLCLNDFPIGIYTSQAKVDKAIKQDKVKRRKHMARRDDEQPLYYHTATFTIDTDPHL